VAFGEDGVDEAHGDTESLWCTNVTRMQERLMAAGAASTIEKAVRVGAAPVERLLVSKDSTMQEMRPALRTGTRTLG